MFQLFHILTFCNTVGCRIFGLASDAGGNNARLFSLLRHTKKLPDVASLSPEFVTFQDPTIYENITIAMFHCATHNLKAARNAYLASSIAGARNFLNTDNIPFGWQNVIECYSRDQHKVINGYATVTNLTLASAKPDGWSKMNVKHAKAPFAKKTICSIFSYLGEEFGCHNEMLFDGTTEENKDICCKYSERLKILKRHLSLKKLNNHNNTKIRQWESELAGLEYSATVGSLFNETFLDKSKFITQQNITQYEKQIEDLMIYYHEWRKAALKRKDDNYDEWDRTFISQQTFNNLRIQISGFFQFAKLMLDSPKGPEYVPFLYSITSSIEAHFSQMRATGSDTARSYQSNIGVQTVTSTMKNLEKSGMYTVDDTEYGMEVNTLQHGISKLEEYRQLTIANWESNSKDKVNDNLNIPIIGYTMVPDIPLNKSQTKTAENNALKLLPFFYLMNETAFQTHFSSHIKQNTHILEYAKVSIGTESATEEWFKSFYTLNNENELLFDKLCQWLLTNIMRMFHRSAISSEIDPFSSFWYNIYVFANSDGMRNANFIKDLP